MSDDRSKPDHPKHEEWLQGRREHYARNRERMHLKQKRIRENRSAAQREYQYWVQGNWKVKHREHVRQLMRANYVKNRAKVLEQAKQKREAVRAETLAHYGGRCACCGEQTQEFLTIDHINNDGRLERIRPGKKSKGPAGTSFYFVLRRRGWPTGYQVLCYNCNCAKSCFGQCPHQRLGQAIA